MKDWRGPESEGDLTVQKYPFVPLHCHLPWSLHPSSENSSLSYSVSRSTRGVVGLSRNKGVRARPSSSMLGLGRGSLYPRKESHRVSRRPSVHGLQLLDSLGSKTRRHLLPFGRAMPYEEAKGGLSSPPTYITRPHLGSIAVSNAASTPKHRREESLHLPDTSDASVHSCDFVQRDTDG